MLDLVLINLFCVSDGGHQSNYVYGSDSVVEFNVVTVEYKNISFPV